MTRQDQQVAVGAIVEDRAWLGKLRGELRGLLAPVFAQARSRWAAFACLDGLLAEPGDRRSCWQLAEAAGHRSPRRMQALLAGHRWDWASALRVLQAFVVTHLGVPGAVLAIDETAELKKGAHTVAVARQYAGITGQVENCQTIVPAAYVTGCGHAPSGFRLYLPKAWCGDQQRRQRARVPAGVDFATKTELATGIITSAAEAKVPFGWVAAGELYGRARRVRAACENAGKGYVVQVPRNFKVTLTSGRKATVATVASLVPDRCWETRSCGPGCKGHRDYAWSWIATRSPRHWVLLRRSRHDPAEVAYFYCHAPAGRPVTLPILIKVAGRRWPAGECHQQEKGQTGLDQHQVRLWHSFHRHTVLPMRAQALLAVATARPGPQPGGHTSDAGPDGQPEPWRDSGILPASATGRPPEDPGLVKVSVPEARRLLRLATTPMTRTARDLGYTWSRWRRKHQARARWHHYHKRLLTAHVT